MNADAEGGGRGRGILKNLTLWSIVCNLWNFQIAIATEFIINICTLTSLLEKARESKSEGEGRERVVYFALAHVAGCSLHVACNS